MSSHAVIKRVYVEKRKGFDNEAQRLKSELQEFLGVQHPELNSLKRLRILHRYDAAQLDDEQFELASHLVFSEPQCDTLHTCNDVPANSGDRYFGIEYLSGQYDVRADSAEQCIELAVGVRPRIKTARIYVLSGKNNAVSDEALEAVKKYLINPVDSREADLELPESLEAKKNDIRPVPRLEDFNQVDIKKLDHIRAEYGLAMSIEDLIFCRDFFKKEGRNPTLAELRVLDTYWSDHCRHSTFTTVLDRIDIQDGPDASALKKALERYEQTRIEVYGEAASSRDKSLMDIAVIGAKAIRKKGLAPDIEESREINACSVRVEGRFYDQENPDTEKTENWLLMFKNETHNHPTEIEPFGGAATCLGGAIRDPLSGRAYVHQAMRVSGGADPRMPLSNTLPNKLPQLKIAREAAAGYSSYGNQIGLATGQVSEFYHAGFAAKRMELGAVIAAVPEAWVRREEPAPGDLVLLVGGKTGRDGIGGATGSSKAHTEESVREAGAEVQKGNPVEERKIQRLFRKEAVSRLIKRCNDFGAGGVSVAVGELAGGLDINLDAVPKKYAGLDGVELAISESQERMAVVVAPEDAERFIQEAAEENIDAVVIARITAGDSNHCPDGSEARLCMDWNGQRIVDLPRSFLDTNGAERKARVIMAPVTQQQNPGTDIVTQDVAASALLDRIEHELRSLRSGSRRGLQERFDGSIGSASVLFPWGGSEQGTPECGMAALLPVLGKETRTVSLMSFGYDPELAMKSPYKAAKGAVKEALAKIACLGGDPWKARLSLQEYFERTDSPEAWGKPLAALLGALEAQLELNIPAIGGKDSMSGTYKDPENDIALTVPPTLVAFAASAANAENIRSGALSGVIGNPIVLLYQHINEKDDTETEWNAFRKNMDTVKALGKLQLIKAAYPVQAGGIGTTLALMAFGNACSVQVNSECLALHDSDNYQGWVLLELDAVKLEEMADKADAVLKNAAAWTHAALSTESLSPAGAVFTLVSEPSENTGSDISGDGTQTAETSLAMLRRAYEYPLLHVYPQCSDLRSAAEAAVAELALDIPLYTKGCKQYKKAAAPLKGSAPLVVLPAFPGTNCEWDMEKAFLKAGARTKIIVFRNRDRQDIIDSTNELAAALDKAQILALSGGFSAGDEPEGSGKFIANALRASKVQTALSRLLDTRDGLALGICNGFQALIKLGLLPFGTFKDADASMPTLTYNSIGRHVSRMVHTKLMSNASPWLSQDSVGDIHTIPVSHGEGRLIMDEAMAKDLMLQGQVAFCYTDAQGRPTMAEPYNPNGSAWAVEGLCSPDGRILGKMGHSERCGPYVHINIPGNKEQSLFKAGVSYFS